MTAPKQASTNTCGKIGYPDAASAHVAAQVIRSGKRGRRHRAERAYRCPSCGAFHITRAELRK